LGWGGFSQIEEEKKRKPEEAWTIFRGNSRMRGDKKFEHGEKGGNSGGLSLSVQTKKRASRTIRGRVIKEK